MESEGNDVFDLFEFYFMPVGTKMVGEKIKDTPMRKSLGEDWKQWSLILQEPLGIPPPPYQDLVVLGKGSVTPLPLVTQVEEE